LEKRVGEQETKHSDFWRVDWGALQQKIGMIDTKIEVLTHKITESQDKFTQMNAEISAVERRLLNTVDGLCKTLDATRLTESVAREALERRLSSMEQRWWKVAGGWAVLCAAIAALFQFIEPRPTVQLVPRVDAAATSNHYAEVPAQVPVAPLGYSYQLVPNTPPPPSTPPARQR
jgi:septal ring factor EnvC (AmiA/AmiB activator)